MTISQQFVEKTREYLSSMIDMMGLVGNNPGSWFDDMDTMMSVASQVLEKYAEKTWKVHFDSDLASGALCGIPDPNYVTEIPDEVTCLMCIRKMSQD